MAHQKKKASPACAACDISVPHKICFTDQGKGPDRKIRHPDL
jgi:hypothetical protein